MRSRVLHAMAALLLLLLLLLPSASLPPSPCQHYEVNISIIQNLDNSDSQ